MQLIHTAMIQEAELIINKYNLQQFDQLKNIKFYKNNDLVLVFSGIWKIQTGIGMSYILQKFNFEKIINIWIAGNTWKQSNSKVWDIFFPTIFWQHDMYLPFEGSHLDYALKPIQIDLKFNIDNSRDFSIFENAICATWDQFIDDEKKVEQIKKQFDADIIDMEAFAFVSVLREFGLLDKAVVIKSVSDSANQDAIVDHERNLKLAMENGLEVLDKIL